MELNIRGRLLRELFDEKIVTCSKDLYVRSYPALWPCEDAFREFLTTPDVSIQMSCAKTICICIGAEEVERQRGCPLAFVKWERSGDSRVIYRHDANLPVGVLYAVKEMLPLNFEGILICYYLCMEDFKQSFWDCSGVYKAFRIEAQQFDTYLPEKLRRQFSLIYHDSCITQAFYEICDWHQTHWGQVNGGRQIETFRYGEALSACFSKAIQESVKRESEAVLKNAKVTVENLEEIIERLGKRIQTINAGKIQKDAIYNYVHIGIRQQDTRRSDSASEPGKKLVDNGCAVDAEAELVEIWLKFGTTAMVGTQDEGLEIAD